MEEMDLREEVRVAWGTGIAGYVAESGDPVNIPDAYQVSGEKTFEIRFPRKMHSVELLSDKLQSQRASDW